MNDFLNNIYGTIFSPRETFEKLLQNPPLLQGLIIVFIISVINPLLHFQYCSGLKCSFLLIFRIFSSALGGIISWVFFAAFFELIASVFKQSGRIKEFLTLSAFALIPWIFIAPANLFKFGGVLGSILGILLGLGIWLWTVVLIVIAVMKAYNLSIERAIILLIVPFFGGLLASHWIVGFFVTLFNILKI